MSSSQNTCEFTGYFGPEFSEIISGMVQNLLDSMSGQDALTAPWPAQYEAAAEWAKASCNAVSSAALKNWTGRLTPPDDSTFAVTLYLQPKVNYDSKIAVQHSYDGLWYIRYKVAVGEMEVFVPEVASVLAEFTVLALRYKLVATPIG